MAKFILPILGVGVGIAIALFFKKNTYFVKILLAFSGAFLLASTIFELLPDLYKHLDSKSAGLFIAIGILLQLTLELFSKGAEHGHVHHETPRTTWVPWALLISLCLHSFLEGFAIQDHSTIVYGILVHKMPIAALMTTFLWQSKYSKPSITFFLLLFTSMTPLGTFISEYLVVASTYQVYFNALAVGIFLHVSTTILFESGQAHTFNISKFTAIVLGIGLAYLI